MSYDPRNPLTAQDAKILTDLAAHEEKRPATDLWIENAKNLIMEAAKAQQTNLDLEFDPAIVNQAVIFKYLAVTCGYTTVVDLVNDPNLFKIDWKSAKRLQTTPPSNTRSDYGYNFNAN